MIQNNNLSIFVDNLRSFVKDYPQITEEDWFICTHNSITSFVPVEERFNIIPALSQNNKYNQETNQCQAKYIDQDGDFCLCDNDADLFGITLLCDVNTGNKLGVRFKFYCAECMAQRAMVNLPILTDPDTFQFEEVDEYGHTSIENIDEVFIIQQRVSFFEHYLDKSMEIIEEKYPEKIEELTEGLFNE